MAGPSRHALSTGGAVRSQSLSEPVAQQEFPADQQLSVVLAPGCPVPVAVVRDVFLLLAGAAAVRSAKPMLASQWIRQAEQLAQHVVGHLVDSRSGAVLVIVAAAALQLHQLAGGAR